MRSAFTKVGSAAVVAAMAATGVIGTAGAAQADTAPSSPTEPKTVSTDALPTVQVDGVVWNQVVSGNTVFVGGNFQTARPAGAAPGVDTVSRKYLLAYDIRTGELINSFAPAVNGQILGMTLSPDGSRLYIAGDFTNVGGVNHYRIAAVNTSDGSIINGFNASVDSRARTIYATNSAVYVGGNFTTTRGVSRSRLAAFSPTTGALLNWAPTATGASGQSAQVMGIAPSPDGTKLVVAGQFSLLNGVSAQGMGSVDLTTGATQPWAATSVIRNYGSSAAIYSLTSANGKVYGTGYWFGGTGNFEGTFAADGNTGEIQWMEDCHGDSYSSFPMNGVVYAASHSHYCNNVGGFPQTTPWTMHRGQAWTDQATHTLLPDTVGYPSFAGQPAPTNLNWFPTVDAGTFTGQGQGAWSLSGNSDYLVMGGEFPKVNGQAQYGLVRYARTELAPNKEGPQVAGAAYKPTLQSPAAGVVTGTIPANYDFDNETLTYKVFRQGVETPVYQTTEKSRFYNRPTIAFIDKTAPAGTSVQYRVQATDPMGNSAMGEYVAVNVSNTGSITDYGLQVLQDGANTFWRLGEATGNTVDWAGNNTGVTKSGVTRGAEGAIDGDADKASTFNGTANGIVSATNSVPGPNTFTAEAWIKTTTTSGGKILGFGNSQTGISTNYDRHIFMQPDGHLTFGVYPGQVKTVTSAAKYNNGQWHHVVASLGTDGMKLYVDDALVGSDATVQTAQGYTGYWRVGGDNLDGWGTGASRFFNGTIDEVAIYNSVLTPTQLSNHFSLSGHGAPIPNNPPTAAFTSSSVELDASFDASTSTDSDGTIADYSWDFGDGTTGSGVNPTHTYADAGTFNVTLTVKDNDNDTNAVDHDVTVAVTPPVVDNTLATDTFERSVAAGGWGTADKGGAWAPFNGASNFSVSDGQAKMSVAAGQTRRMALNAVDSTTSDTTVSMTLTRPVGGSVYAAIIGRRLDVNNDYRAKVRVYDNGDVTVGLVRTIGGVETTLTAVKVPAMVFNTGDTLRIRLQVEGTDPTALKAKVWKVGDVEPAAWNVQTTDATAALQVGGALGLSIYTAGNVTNGPVVVSFDDLVAVKLP